MASLFRNSQIILTRSLYITRTAATTSTSSASNNLSEASRSADGTDMAMRDAEQRGTSANQNQLGNKHQRILILVLSNLDIIFFFSVVLKLKHHGYHLLWEYFLLLAVIMLILLTQKVQANQKVYI